MQLRFVISPVGAMKKLRRVAGTLLDQEVEHCIVTLLGGLQFSTKKVIAGQIHYRFDVTQGEPSGDDAEL